IRLVSVERGYDPRDFALVAFGGAGPLHGADLAALLAMRTVVVPRHPGVLSTFGLLGTQVRNDYDRTLLQKPPDYDLGAVAAVYVRRLPLPRLGRARVARTRPSRRRVFSACTGWRDCPCVDRETLGAGAVVIGPAVVEQLDSTTVVAPGQRAMVDGVGNLVL